MLIATLNIELMKLFGVNLMFWVIMVTATASTAARQQLKVSTRLRHHSSRSMPSMKREELVQAIRAMGEEPPRQWSKTELQVRLTELEEEHGVTRVKGRQHTNLQLWMVRLNEAKKLKSTLVTFVENELGLSVQPNQTIARLTQEAVEKIYHISKPSASDRMGFGRNANKTYEEVIQTEPSYVKWARNTVAEGSTCARLWEVCHLARDVREPIDHKDGHLHQCATASSQGQVPGLSSLSGHSQQQLHRHDGPDPGHVRDRDECRGQPQGGDRPASKRNVHTRRATHTPRRASA